MSDLISRKVVLKLIWELLEISEYDGDKIIMVKDDIEKLPTAYDVNKVVEQLTDKCFRGSGVPGNEKVWLRDAIQLVKGGGRDE